jgi:hypothetical protein
MKPGADLWLMLAIASFLAAVFVPGPAPLVSRSASPELHARWEASTAGPITMPAAPPRAVRAPASAATRPQQTAIAADASADTEAIESASAASARPMAGRQVLRCRMQGRVTYMDADGACPEGPGERITVFPTQGLGPTR